MELRRHGVEVEYAMSDYPDTPEGRLNKHIRATIAEFEREKITERMSRGRRQKVEAGNVIVLRGAGAIGGQATWSGLPPDLALIVNGPGQVGYYAREDGSSPLSVNYSVTPADFATGDSWRVSLTAFSAPDVEGSIQLTYP